jgi:hypothetical protein
MGTFIDKGRPKRKHVFVGYQESIRGLISSAGVSASTGVGDAPEAEAASLSAVGLDMEIGEEHDWFWPIPNDLNQLHSIGFKVRYSSASTTDTDDREWIILYDVIAEDAAMALGTTALDTVIVAELDNGTADAWQESSRGVLNGGTITEANVAAMDLLAINLELNVEDSSSEMNMYGIIIDYVPKRGAGDPSTYQGDPYQY